MRERIDLAFHIMDREYGVTRLLDPEGKPSFTVIVICHLVISTTYLHLGTNRKLTRCLFLVSK